MTDKQEKIKVIDCKASDNEYLHKDFHGALCCAIKYLDDNYGHDATAEYFKQVGTTYFAPLTQQLKKDGLKALENHWQKVFSKEGGKFRLHYEDQMRVLTVDKCPAIAHLKKINQFFTERYCESTVVVNETICNVAGYRCSCQYEPGKGKCVQKFWKEME